jgi:beta-lactamase regulating signal transducer with metallopeptidase domain
MQNFIEYQALPLLLKASWQAAVIILVVLAAQYTLARRWNPRWRYALWWLVVARLALPATLPSRVSLFNVLPLSGGGAPVWEAGANARLEPIIPPVEAATTHPAGARQMGGGLSPWLWLWAGGALFMAVGLGSNHFRIHRKVAPCRPLINGPVMNLLEDCKQQMGVRTPITLVETEAVDGPCLFGVLRPRLLLPPGFTSGFSLDELRFVFLHELGHVKRHDIPLGWLIALLQILHWFNPLVWLAFYRMRADRELACDALALAHAADQDNKPYGRTIVKLLENFGNSLRAPGLAGIVEDKEQMKERILMIARFHKSNRGFAMAASLVIGLGLLTLTDAQLGCKSPTARTGDKSPPAVNNPEEEQQLKMAQAGNKWAAYWLWDSYYRGKNGIKADPARAEKWLREFVRDVWVVKFEPVNGFAPASPEEFLARIHQYADNYSDQTKIGESGFFRTTKQGGKLIGSFLSNYPDLLKLSLAKVPGLKVTSVEKITPEKFIKYEQSTQESL